MHGWFSYAVWHPEKDSNSHLTVLETVVLTLNYQGKLAVRTGVEPVTPG